LWIVSFSDMVANLVTFFIILACFAGSDDGKGAAVVESGVGVHGTRSTPPATAMVAKPRTSDGRFGVDGQDRPSQRQEERLDAALDKLQTPVEYDVAPDLERLAAGMRIRLTADGLFRPGSSSMSEAGVVIVREIGSFFRGEACTLIVEGHADALPGESSDTAATRSQGMAKSIARVLVGSGFESFRVAIAPRAAEVPLASNETPAGRRQNRRIEIIVRGGA
jgi:flagellar motor protein MotB